MMRRAAEVAIVSMLLLGAAAWAVYAYPPNDWEIVVMPLGSPGGEILWLGTIFLSVDNDVYGAARPIQPGDVGVYVLEHMEQGAGFPGDTGLYGAAYRAAIPSGGSKTWWDIYLWAQNYAPATPYRTLLRTGSGDYDWRPLGYVGHLVLDYVPAGCAWNGPMDFWLNLGVTNTFTLPMITTSDPLQGTKFHLTVYAPEPSSLLTLAGGIAGLGGFLLRRRRR